MDESGLEKSQELQERARRVRSMCNERELYMRYEKTKKRNRNSREFGGINLVSLYNVCKIIHFTVNIKLFFQLIYF